MLSNSIPFHHDDDLQRIISPRGRAWDSTFPRLGLSTERIPRARVASKSVSTNLTHADALYASPNPTIPPAATQRSSVQRLKVLSESSSLGGHRAQASLSSDVSDRRRPLPLSGDSLSCWRYPVFISTLVRPPAAAAEATDYRLLATPSSFSGLAGMPIEPTAAAARRFPHRLRSCAASLRPPDQNQPQAPSPPPPVSPESPPPFTYRRRSLSRSSLLDSTRTAELRKLNNVSKPGRLRTCAERPRLVTRPVPSDTATVWKSSRYANVAANDKHHVVGLMPPGLVGSITADAKQQHRLARISCLPTSLDHPPSTSMFIESMVRRVQEFRQREGPIFGVTNFIIRRPVNLPRTQQQQHAASDDYATASDAARKSAQTSAAAVSSTSAEGSSFNFWENVLTTQVLKDGSNADQIIQTLARKAAKHNKKRQPPMPLPTQSPPSPPKESHSSPVQRRLVPDESGLEEDDITVASTTARSPRRTAAASPLLRSPETSSSSLRSSSTKLLRHQSENYGSKVLYPLSQRLEPMKRAFGHQASIPGRQTISTSSELTRKPRPPSSSDCCSDSRLFFLRANSPVARVMVKPDQKADLLCDLPPEWKIDVTQVQLQGKAISKGTFGTVFKAKWNDEIVAVKWCHADASSSVEQLRNFERELNAYCALRHERICKFYGACVDSLETLALVTEYCPNGNVFDLLFDNKIRVSSSERLRMACHLVEIVAYLHSLNPVVIHRDLKTPNLILDRDFNLKLCDFGKTRFMYRSFLMLDDNGGSPRYMAPECFIPNGVISEKADVWSMACCLIEIFGGPIPHEEYYENASVIQRILTDQQAPMIPYWFCPSVQSILKACFSWNPAGRPSAKDVQHVILSLTVHDLDAYGMNERRTR